MERVKDYLTQKYGSQGVVASYSDHEMRTTCKFMETLSLSAGVRRFGVCISVTPPFVSGPLPMPVVLTGRLYTEPAAGLDREIMRAWGRWVLDDL